MISALGNWLGNHFLQYLSDNGGWLALFEADPTALGLLEAELAGGGYLRQRILFGPPSNKTVASINAQRFVGLPVSHVPWLGVWSAPSAGDFLFRVGPLDPAIDVALDGQFLAAVGDVALVL